MHHWILYREAEIRSKGELCYIAMAKNSLPIWAIHFSEMTFSELQELWGKLYSY